MTDWQADLLEKAMQATDTHSFFDGVAAVALKLGFDYTAYGARQRFPLTRPRLFIINNYSEAWKSAYAVNRYLNIDPYVAQCLKSSCPVVWDRDLKACKPAFWEDAGAYGLAEGWGQSLLSRDAQGLVTFARSKEPITAKELKTKQAALCWLGQITHLGMGRLQKLNGGRDEPADIVLSQREKEILQWTADGKSSADISVILGITQRTVNFHIHHCIEKLECQNKIAAAVKASLMGLLWG